VNDPAHWGQAVTKLGWIAVMRDNEAYTFRHRSKQMAERCSDVRGEVAAA